MTISDHYTSSAYIDQATIPNYMKWIKRIFIGLVLLIIAFISLQYLQYRRGIETVEAALPGPSKIAETALGPVEYQVQGTSDQYVMLIHGTPGSYHTFMADALVDVGFTVISPSRPGYFRTPVSAGQTIVAQADLFAALLDQLAIDSAAIIGFSGGGPSAIQFAARHPQRCTGMVVLASAGRTFAKPDPPFMEEMMMGSEFGRWIGYTSLSGQLDGEAADKALNYLQTAFFPMEQVMQGEANDFEQFALEWNADLKRIQCPTLIVHGTEDELIPFAEAQYLASEISDATLIAKENQDHFTVVFFEFEENLKAAAEFLNSN